MNTFQKFIYILLIVLIFSFMQPVMARAAVTLDSVHYSISGNLDKLEALRLRLENRLDQINQLYLTAVHDGNKLNLEGRWNIKFLERDLYRAKLGLALTLDLDQFNLGRGLAIAGEGNYLTHNRYFWDLVYYFNREKSWVYEGGLALPLSQTSFLTLSVGNSYWKPADPVLSMGVKVEM